MADAPGPLPRNGRRTGWRRWLQLGGVIGFINWPAGLAIGLVAAILSVPLLVGIFLLLDRFETEPTR